MQLLKEKKVICLYAALKHLFFPAEVLVHCCSMWGTITSINVTRSQVIKRNLRMLLLTNCGPGSSVGIATDYRLDGPGSNPSRCADMLRSHLI